MNQSSSKNLKNTIENDLHVVNKNIPNITNGTKSKFKKLIGAAALSASIATPGGNIRADTSYTVPPEFADMAEYSSNSVEGAGIYMCTPRHVEEGACTGVDDRYYQSIERLGLASYNMKIITYNNGKKAIGFNGVFNRGSGDAFIQVLSSYPEIDTIIFNSKGGLIDEADKMISYIKEKELTTKVIGPWICLSACSDVIMAGKEIEIDGVVGIHIPSRTITNPEKDENPVLQKLEKNITSSLSVLNENLILWIKQGNPINESMFSLIETPSVVDDPAETTILSHYILRNTSMSKEILESQKKYINYVLKIARIHSSFGGNSTILVQKALEAKGEFIIFSSLEEFKNFSGEAVKSYTHSEIVEIAKPRITPNFKFEGLEEIR